MRIILPKAKELVELEGTDGVDRVEVIVTIASRDLGKVIGQLLPYKTRG